MNMENNDLVAKRTSSGDRDFEEISKKNNLKSNVIKITMIVII